MKKLLLPISLFILSCNSTKVTVMNTRNDTIQSQFYNDSLYVIQYGEVTTFKYIPKNKK